MFVECDIVFPFALFLSIGITGLCPGLNTVVREVAMCLRRQYGVNEVYGIPAGYRGFKSPETWRLLDEEAVKNLHNQGGSVLGSSRGGHDTEAIVDSLVEKGINLLFVVGGDGTVRGAARIAEEVKKRKMEISVAVVPKTIDNDVPLLDRTFGFETAVSSAREAIDVANTGTYRGMLTFLLMTYLRKTHRSGRVPKWAGGGQGHGAQLGFHCDAFCTRKLRCRLVSCARGRLFP